MGRKRESAARSSSQHLFSNQARTQSNRNKTSVRFDDLYEAPVVTQGQPKSRRPTSENTTSKAFRNTNIDYPISTGSARLESTSDHLITVFVNGVPSSAIDISDPGFLIFEYMQQMDAVVENQFPGPIKALHLGAAACSLSWAWAHKHPESRQIAVDIDTKLVELVRTWFDLPRAPKLRIRAQDAYDAVLTAKPESFNVIVRDVFTGNATPAKLTTTEFATAVKQALTNNGIYLANCADRPPLTEARQELENLKATFGIEQIGLIAEKGIINGKRYGNLVLVARKANSPTNNENNRENLNNEPPSLENPALARALRSLPVPTAIVTGAELANFLAQRKVNI